MGSGPWLPAASCPDPAVTGRVIRELGRGQLADDHEHGTPRAPLSPREDEILRLVAWGYSHKEIATQLELVARQMRDAQVECDAQAGIAQPDRHRALRVAQGLAARKLITPYGVAVRGHLRHRPSRANASGGERDAVRAASLRKRVSVGIAVAQLSRLPEACGCSSRFPSMAQSRRTQSRRTSDGMIEPARWRPILRLLIRAPARSTGTGNGSHRTRPYVSRRSNASGAAQPCSPVRGYCYFGHCAVPAGGRTSSPLIELPAQEQMLRGGSGVERIAGLSVRPDWFVGFHF